MLHTNTCMILGAGASKDVKLPLGMELLGTIHAMAERDSENRSYSRELNPEGLLWLMRRGQNQDWGALNEAVRIICRGALHCASIDDFLNIHQGNQTLVTL